MARYRDYSYEQAKLIPISFQQQILPGTFEHTSTISSTNNLISRYLKRATATTRLAPRLTSSDSAEDHSVCLFARDGLEPRDRKALPREHSLHRARRGQPAALTTIADFVSTSAEEMERAIRYLIACHRELDRAQGDSSLIEREHKQLKTLRERVNKIKCSLENNDDKRGKSGQPKKSNVTDNEGAKMKSAHGVIQGYDGVAAVDAKAPSHCGRRGLGRGE
jgi:hypothetical protein